jgi:hypothetical protein
MKHALITVMNSSGSFMRHCGKSWAVYNFISIYISDIGKMRREESSVLNFSPISCLLEMGAYELFAVT